MPDPVDGVGGHPGVDELGQPAVGCDHSERRVAGADELPGRFDDAAQHHGQRQVPADHLVGAQQTAQPALGGDDLLRPLDELLQQLVELQSRQVREGEFAVVLGVDRSLVGNTSHFGSPASGIRAVSSHLDVATVAARYTSTAFSPRIRATVPHRVDARGCIR